MVSGSVDALELTETAETPISRFEFTGSVEPERVGLIGVSTGFTAIVATPSGDFVPGANVDTLEFQPGEAPFIWDNVAINTSATGSFRTSAQINGWGDFNNIGLVQFDWVITGISSIDVDLDFALSVSTSLVVNNGDGGGFVGSFDANFSNTATLTNVTVFNNDELNPIALDNFTLVDTVNEQSLVAAVSVPEPSAALILVLAGCAGSIRRRRTA